MCKRMMVKNTNKVLSLSDFFRGFGYDDNDRIYFRMFEDDLQKKNTPDGLWWDPKQKRTKGRNEACRLSELQTVLPVLDRFNRDHTAGVFFVVNGGGNSDSEVLRTGRARAQFFEIDDRSFSEQEKLIRNAPLAPSIIVKTAKSYHSYYVLRDGRADRFRAIQATLASYFGGDQSVKNESRVMRVPSFYHNKLGKVSVEVQHFNPSRVYTQDDILAAFRGTGQNLAPDKEVSAAQASINTGTAIREPNRHRTLYALSCRCIEAGLTRGAIINALQYDNKKRCEPPLPDDEIVNIIDCSFKYRRGEAGRAAYRKQKRMEVLMAYETD